MIKEMDFYFNIEKKYNLVLYKSSSQDCPGRIIYEDEYQITVTNIDHKKIKIEELQY
jgi:hypothetical protein